MDWKYPETLEEANKRKKQAIETMVEITNLKCFEVDIVKNLLRMNTKTLEFLAKEFEALDSF